MVINKSSRQYDYRPVANIAAFKSAGEVAGVIVAVPDTPLRVAFLEGSSAFPHDIFGSLVVSQAEESGVAQFVTRCPLRETDLGHELWLYPMHSAMWQLVLAEGAGRRLKLRELSAEAL